MSYSSLRPDQSVIDLRLIEARQHLEAQVLPRGTTVRQPGWWSWQRDRLLNQVGRRLTALGQRLEHYGLTQLSA